VTFSINQTFHSAVVENLYRAVAETDYDFVLSATTSTRPQAQAIENLLRDRCETIILISPEIDQAQLEDLTTRASVITLGSDLHAANADSVHSDDRQGITDAVNHLVNLGHHSITYIDGGTSAMSEVRRTAYVDAMEAHGLHEQIRIRTGSPTEESGAEIATLILDEEPLPTAILAHNDMIAFGLLLTLRSRGIAVPGDVSIVGYDDTRIAHLSTVQLTSVSQDTSRLAQTAVRRAITRAEDPGTPPGEDFVTPAQLVVRATCGPPRTRRPRQP
jgi:DNA-binding LacI/PurR family transcriptional regulator